MTRTPIFVADFLRAITDLDIDSVGVAQQVMRMLGLESWADLVETAPVDDHPRPADPPRDPGRPSAASSPLPGRTADAGGPPEDLAPATTRLLEGRVTSVRPAWAIAMPALSRARPTEPVVPDSLLDPSQERAILGALAATRVDDGTVDIDQLVDRLARAEPATRLPMRSSWGLRRGLQVLVDRTEAMAPFAADVPYLLDRLDHLLPPDRLRRGAFVRAPLEEVRIRGVPRAPWRPPAAGTAVLVVSALGVGVGSVGDTGPGEAEWLEFADRAARAGVHLRTLVPYRPGWWPPSLIAPMRCIHWDRRTTAGIVRRVLAG
jgi:hypothetical protein